MLTFRQSAACTGHSWHAALLALAGATVALSHACGQTYRYVWKNNPAPSPPYLSWPTAATNINDAIAVAAPGDVIWVTNGIYDTGGRRVSSANGTNRVVIDKPVIVRSVNGPAVTAIVGVQPESAAAVRCVYMTNGAALMGFTLTNGAPSGAGSYPQDAGGGAWCESKDAVISNCVIVGNRGGYVSAGVFRGSVYNSELHGNTGGRGGAAAESLLVNCVMSNNYANWGGGARASELYNCTLISNRVGYSGAGAETSVLSNCVVIGGSASRGGGINECRAYDCIFSNNYAAGGDGGGGAYSGECYRCSFYNNTAGWGGGARYGKYYSCAFIGNTASGAAQVGGGYGGEYYSCRFYNNIAGYGGGGGYGNFYECEIRGNSSGHGGGSYGGTLYNCLLISNYSSGGYTGGAEGGTLYGCRIIGNWAPYYAGGVSYSTAYNCLITGNTGTYSGSGGAFEASLYNCTVVGNSAPGMARGGGVSGGNNFNCVVFNNYDNDTASSNYWGSVTNFSYCCTAPLPPGAGNIAVDPLFADPASGNFRLVPLSPCLNKGLNYPWMSAPSDPRSTDVEGGPRIRHGIVDMGAYELRVSRGAKFSAE